MGIDKLIQAVWFIGNSGITLILGAVLATGSILLARKTIRPLAKWERVVWLVFITSVSIALAGGCVKIINIYQQRSYLETLTHGEKKFLSHYIKYKKKTQYVSFPRHSQKGMAIALVKNNIIYLACDTKTKMDTGAYCNIEDWAYSYLKEHPELLQKKIEGGKGS